MILDQIKVTGKPTIRSYDGNMNLIQELTVDNLIVTTGKQYIAAMIGPNPPSAMSKMAVGTGTTAPTASDTGLQTEIGTRATITTTHTAATTVTTYTATFGPGNGTGALTEAGIFDAATSGNMMARVTFPVVNKDVSGTIVITWQVTIS